MHWPELGQCRVISLVYHALGPASAAFSAFSCGGSGANRTLSLSEVVKFAFHFSLFMFCVLFSAIFFLHFLLIFLLFYLGERSGGDHPIQIHAEMHPSPTSLSKCLHWIRLTLQACVSVELSRWFRGSEWLARQRCLSKRLTGSWIVDRMVGIVRGGHPKE